jgi:hypothetical protein
MERKKRCTVKKNKRIMSTLPQSLQASWEHYIQVSQSLENITQQHKKDTKDLKKKLSDVKRAFRKYMKDNNISKLSVGANTFEFEQKEKVLVTIDRIERAFNSDAVDEYKKKNKEVKTVFTLN